MAQGYDGEIPFADLCNLIYQGFGQYAVIDLVQGRQYVGDLKDVTWHTCEPCEEYLPFYEQACLVCGTNKRADVTVGTDDAVCYECKQDTEGKWYYTYEDDAHGVICAKCYGEES